MRLKLLIFNLTFFFSFLVIASPVDLQGHIRSGVVNGAFSGAETGEFSVFTSFEGEFEYFYGSRTSLLAKATISLDGASGQVKYIHMGLGQRTYIFSRGRPLEADNWGVSSSIRPKLRYFIDMGVGISQIQVRQRTETLVVQTTSVEFGVGAGTIYQVSDNLGIELNLMWSKGLSISSVAIDSTIIRGMLGAVAYF